MNLLIKYSIFSFIINPILVMVGLTVSYRIFGLETAYAAWNPDPFIPYLLVRLFWLPILLTPFIAFFLFIRKLKTFKSFSEIIRCIF